MDIANSHSFIRELEGPAVSALAEMRIWANHSQGRLCRVLEALLQRDVALARAVRSDGSETDTLFRSIHYAVSRTARGRSRTTLAAIALKLKRIADSVTNISEWVVIAITGKMIQS
jgi:phosphate uptake regulator